MYIKEEKNIGERRGRWPRNPLTHEMYIKEEKSIRERRG
jgi:hypothetical protein